MLRRNDGDRLLGDVDAQPQQLVVDVGEMASHEIFVPVRDVKVDIVEAQALDERLRQATCRDVGGGPAHVLGVGGEHGLANGRTLQGRRQIGEQAPALLAGSNRSSPSSIRPIGGLLGPTRSISR